ncbi:MAG: hypothetical protein IT257_05310, partial [Chitinophagaceae bacterium]|nr:hypothetical protein [Chitinophagaceae bacterium]
IMYCKPLQGEAKLLYEMSQVDPKPYDAAIEAIFAKYMNRHQNMRSYFSLDSIMLEVAQLPLFVDAIWNNCVPQVASPDGVSDYRLGVIFKADTEAKTIQRVYIVNNSLEKGQVLVEKKYDTDFVSRTRRQCEGHDE